MNIALMHLVYFYLYSLQGNNSLETVTELNHYQALEGGGGVIPVLPFIPLHILPSHWFNWCVKVHE